MLFNKSYNIGVKEKGGGGGEETIALYYTDPYNFRKHDPWIYTIEFDSCI